MKDRDPQPHAERSRTGRAWASFCATLLVLTVAGALPRAVAGISTQPVDPGNVRLLANCFDACTVTIQLSGNGSGTWKSTNSGGVPNGLINCVWQNGSLAPGSDCSEVYCCVDRASPVTIYYTLTPAPGNKACHGAIGCISGPISSSRALPSQNTPVGIPLEGSFYLIPYGVDIAYGGTGVGSASSSPSGIFCPPSCSYSFNYGTELTLTATPNGDSYFDHWTGACAGQDATCNLTVTGPVTTMYFLTLGSPPTASPAAPTPTATAAATPRVTAKPAGTPTPGKTAGPTTGATSAPVSSHGQGTPDPGSTDPGATLPVATSDASVGPAAPAATDARAAPVVATGSDLTPIALAILGAGLLIAIGIGFAAVMIRRRSPPPSS